MSAIGQKKSFERHRFVLFLCHFFQQSWTCEFHHGKTVSQSRLGPHPSVPHLIRMNKKLWSHGGGPSGLGFGSMEGVSVKWLLTCLNPVPYLSCCVFVGRGFQKFKCWFLWGCLYPFDTPPPTGVQNGKFALNGPRTWHWLFCEVGMCCPRVM